MKIIVEPSGAVPIAGIMKMKSSIKKSKVGAIISGGNINLNDFFNEYYNNISKWDIMFPIFPKF